MTINTFVRTNKLEPGDVLKVKQKNAVMVTPIIVYLGFTGIEHKFITNTKIRGVDWLTQSELAMLSNNYNLINIRRFRGSIYAQQPMILKAVRSMKKYAYHFLTANQQQLANYANIGTSAKQQSQLIGTGIAATGVLLATTSKNEAAQAFGIFAAIAGAIIALSNADE